jgi:hypothetical protein
VRVVASVVAELVVAALAEVEIETVVRDQPPPPLLQTKRSLKRWVKAE